MKQLSFLVNKSNGVEVLFVDLSHLTGEKCQNWIRANHQMFDEMKSEISEVFSGQIQPKKCKREKTFFGADILLQWSPNGKKAHIRCMHANHY